MATLWSPGPTRARAASVTAASAAADLVPGDGICILPAADRHLVHEHRCLCALLPIARAILAPAGRRVGAVRVQSLPWRHRGHVLAGQGGGRATRRTRRERSGRIGHAALAPAPPGRQPAALCPLAVHLASDRVPCTDGSCEHDINRLPHHRGGQWREPRRTDHAHGGCQRSVEPGLCGRPNDGERRHSTRTSAPPAQLTCTPLRAGRHQPSSRAPPCVRRAACCS